PQGTNCCVVVALTPSGVVRWRTSFLGEPHTVVVDPRTGTTYVGVSWTPYSVVAISEWGELRTLVSGPTAEVPLAVGPDGTVYLGTDPRGGVGPATLTAVTPHGDVRWRFSPAPAGYGVGAPAVAPDGTVIVAI